MQFLATDWLRNPKIEEHTGGACACGHGSEAHPCIACIPSTISSSSPPPSPSEEEEEDAEFLCSYKTRSEAKPCIVVEVSVSRVNPSQTIHPSIHPSSLRNQWLLNLTYLTRPRRCQTRLRTKLVRPQRVQRYNTNNIHTCCMYVMRTWWMT